MTTQEGRAAGWFEDPAKVGELRYFDGEKWTEHVTIDGVQTTAPYEAPEAASASVADPASTRSFTMTRGAQWRTEEEKSLEVLSPAGHLGRFVTTLDGAPGYRFEDAHGHTVLSVSKPSLKNTIEVLDPAGYRVGTITKIGRLHSRYDITCADSDATATVRLVPGTTDEWELQVDSGRAATITRTNASPADPLNLAEVEYSASVTAPIDDRLQHLLLAIPIAIDILDTQAL